MRVLRIIPELDFGGVEQRVRLTMLAFRSIPNVEIKVVVLGRGGSISEKLKKEGFNPLILNQHIRIPNFRLIYQLQRLVKAFKPDVVHCSAGEANFHGLIAAWMCNVPLRIGEEIGFPHHGLVAKYVFKAVYSLSHKVVAISNSVSKNIVELGEVREEKVSVIFNPVAIPDPDEAFHANRKCNGFVFVTACRLVPVKNLHMLIEVFAGLVKHYPNKRLLLHVVGDGPEKTKLKAISRTLDTEETVQFEGFQEQVLPYLMNSDAFVLPSFSEGFSISLVEAMLCGLPCIVTKNGGPSEVIKDKETGFLIDPSDENELFKAMEQVIIMGNRERKAIGKRAKREAERFSVDSYVCELLKLYSS